MHFKGLDLNLLLVLDVLLTEKSTTRAGERLMMSQSAVSGALSRLREYFGDQILVPAGQKMVLTSFGERLVQPVHEILQETEALISSTTSFNPATSTRSFLLNMSDVSATTILAKCLPLVRQLAPGIHLEFVWHHENVTEIIEQGECDFVVVPEMMVSPQHPQEVLYDDHYVCIAWSGNRLVKKGLSEEQFFSLRHVTARMIRRTHHMGDHLLRNSEKKPQFEVVLPTFGLVPLAVVGTDMIAVVTKRIADYYASYLPLRVFPSPIEIPSNKSMLQWNRHHEHDQGTQWLRRIIVETVRASLD